MANDTAEPEAKTSFSNELAYQFARGLFYLSLFPLVTDRDAPIHRRFWRWRYCYGVFLLGTAVVYAPKLLEGEFVLLIAAPVFHLLGVMIVLMSFTSGSVPAIEYPIPDVFVGAGAIAIALVGVMIHQQRGIRYHYDPDTKIAMPMGAVDETSDGAPNLPKFERDVSTVFLGTTGAGKTTAMKMYADQYPYGEQTAVVAHDYTDEFQHFVVRRTDLDIVRIGHSGSSVTWNLFTDIRDETDFREVTEAIFPEPSGHDPFHEPAKETFTAILRYLALEERMGHGYIREFVDLPQRHAYDRLSEYSHLARAAENIDPDAGKGARTIWTKIHNVTNRVFVGDFAENGHFSIRSYLEDPQGTVLVIDNEPTKAETLGPMFRLLVDWSIRFAMESDTDTNYILDEVDSLPRLRQLPELTARGRKEGVRALIGAQTYDQLESLYGGEASKVIANCPQGVFFGSRDQATQEYMAEVLLGKRRETITQESVSRKGGDRSRSRSARQVDRTPIPSGAIADWGPGECLVRARKHWWIGQLEQWEQVRPRLRRPAPSDDRDQSELEARTTSSDVDESSDQAGELEEPDRPRLPEPR